MCRERLCRAHRGLRNLEIDDRMREAIAAGVSSSALAHLAAARGHRSLFADAAEKVAAGVTTFGEIERVVGSWVR